MAINQWHALAKTMNFESTAYQVFHRLILGEGPGLLILWGGSPDDPVKANKTYFLNMVESFQKGLTIPKNLIHGELSDLFSLLKPDHFQCVRVIEDCPITQYGNVYQTPLSVAVPLAIVGAAQRRGLVAGRNVVILCDDLQEFMKHNTRANEQFLRDLALSLDEQKNITFLGASRLTWKAKDVLDSDAFKGQHALPLGWD